MWTAVMGAAVSLALALSSAAAPAPSASVAFDYPGQEHGYSDIRGLQSELIDEAPTGSLIVVSVFRITDPTFASDLVNAARKGVHIEVLLDGGNKCTTSGCPHSTVNSLLELNEVHRTDPQTWLRTCDGGTPENGDVATSSGHGCIGQGLNHNKFIALSQTRVSGSSASDVIMQTSSNNTSGQYRHAWNDALVLSSEPVLYQDYLHYFRQLVSASTSSATSTSTYFTDRDGETLDTATIATHDIETWSFPRARNDDPVAQALGQISTAHRCRNVVNSGSSGPSRTHVDAAVAFINRRPILMKELVGLQESGCAVQVIYSDISARDRAELAAGGVQIHQACTPSDSADANTYQYLHSKFVLVDGTDSVVGANRRVVYTGSENWTESALTNADNRMVRYVEKAVPQSVGKAPREPLVFGSYLHRWDEIESSINTNGQPTADTCHGAIDY